MRIVEWNVGEIRDLLTGTLANYVMFTVWCGDVV